MIASIAAAGATVGASSPSAPAAAQPGPTACVLDGDPQVVSGELTPDDQGTYQLVPIEVPAGTTRIEVGYEWGSYGDESSARRTVVDLGLWDAAGYTTPQGFRGWSGSRQGRVHADEDPVFVQADVAARGYRPGPIEAGTWYVELGFGAVHPDGGWWSVEVRCLDIPTVPAFEPDRVDPTHVARNEPGWYRGDFHLHGVHSHRDVPDWDHVIERARQAQLDIVPVTDYVSNTHWDELGPVQRANPDLVIWPGREIITYFGHAIALGETPSTIEYRHGFEGITLGDVQRDTVADSALFGIAHPTIFPGDALAHYCRGCEFRAGDFVDWDLVDTMEVVTGPVAIDPATGARPDPDYAGDVIANPFVPTAIELWDSLLMKGHRITALSGSDDKLGNGYGMTATVVWADSLSRPDVQTALRAGHAYVEAKGQGASPTLEMTATGPSGQSGIFGDTLVGDEADMTVNVRGGQGEEMVVLRNGEEHDRVTVTSDDFTYRFTADRADAADEGPLGTYWRIETHDDVSLTALGNPIFLADELPVEPGNLGSSGSESGSSGAADHTAHTAATGKESATNSSGGNPAGDAPPAEPVSGRPAFTGREPYASCTDHRQRRNAKTLVWMQCPRPSVGGGRCSHSVTPNARFRPRRRRIMAPVDGGDASGGLVCGRAVLRERQMSTSPVTQVTVPPPTQIVPSSS